MENTSKAERAIKNLRSGPQSVEEFVIDPLPSEQSLVLRRAKKQKNKETESRQRYLMEELQRRESEVSELRRNLQELGTKFFQLERAFEINLQSQGHRELEFNSMKHESEERRKLCDEIARERAELNSRLTNAITERDYWKNAFLQQKEFIKRNRVEYDNDVMLLKQEYEDILKKSQETTGKQFQQVVDMHNSAKEQVTNLEEQIKTHKSVESEYKNRIWELANLLETYQRFDVDVGSVCKLLAEALKNLIEQDSFEDSIKSLRQLTWSVNHKKDDPGLNMLKEQNFALKEILKSLKRKALQKSRNEASVGEIKQCHKCAEGKKKENSYKCNVVESNESVFVDSDIPNVTNATHFLNGANNKNYIEKSDETDKSCAFLNVTAMEKEENQNTSFDIQKVTVDRCGRVLYTESHSNGAIFEEYLFKLSIDHELKIKYPISLNNNKEMIKMEFLDNDYEYENATPDKIVILLNNIHALVHVKQNGIPCSTQTSKMKFSNNFSQTTLTGINWFSRLNVGATMLNSERRAIEKSLCILERTVKALKLNTINQAEAMITKDSRLLANDEILNYIKILTR